MQLQKTFKESYMKTLRDAVKSGVAIPLYGNDVFEVDTTQVKRLANVYAPEGLAEKLEVDWESDFKSAIHIYEAFENISPLLASNEAFWAYLTHVDLFSYVQKRWPKVKDNDCSIDYILDHWFLGANGLLRNAIASMWWSVYNTDDEERETGCMGMRVVCPSSYRNTPSFRKRNRRSVIHEETRPVLAVKRLAPCPQAKSSAGHSHDDEPRSRGFFR